MKKTPVHSLKDKKIPKAETAQSTKVVKDTISKPKVSKVPSGHTKPGVRHAAPATASVPATAPVPTVAPKIGKTSKSKKVDDSVSASGSSKVGKVERKVADRSESEEVPVTQRPNQDTNSGQLQTLSRRRYEIIFNNYLVHLLNKLHELEDLGYTEIKENLDHCFLKYSKLVDANRAQEYLDHVHERFQPHMKFIAEQDDFLFSSDYNDGDLRLISGLDLFNIWQFLDATEHSLEFEEDEVERAKCKPEKALDLKKVIWKSLTNLYVSSCLATGRTNDSWATSIMQNLRLAKQLEKEIEEEPDEEEAAGGFGLPNISDFEKIFNSDNALSQIINDVRKEINPEEYMRALNPENKPPLEVIMSLFSGQNHEGLQNVATSLGAKFEDKMKQRGLTEDDLKNAANNMKNDLSKIPGLGMLLSQFNTDLALPGPGGKSVV